MALPEDRVRAMSVTVNHFQQAVLDFVRAGTGHGVVEATAGSGKTTTLVQVARLLASDLLKPGQRACFLAFNRSTAQELRARLPEGIDATTIHALGRRTLVAALSGTAAAPDTDKYRDLARHLLAERAEGPLAALDEDESADYLARLADLVRLELTDATDAAAVAAVADRYRLRSPTATATAELHALLPELLALGVSVGQDGRFDYTDMVYLPVRLGLPPPAYAFVCVDEAQDLSRLNLELVMRLVAGGARSLFVGDPHQAIYAFAGADARSLARITERTGATRLPLSVSFRCPRRHVALARRFAPDMQAAPGAGGGAVSFLAEPDLPRAARPGDLVMTRTNAPLIALALALAERGTAARVLGDELAAETVDLAARLFPTGDIVDGHAVVTASATDEARRLERRLLTDDDLPQALDRSADRHRALLSALTALERRWRPGRQPGEQRRGTRSWPRRPARPTVDDLAAVLEALLGGSAGRQSAPPVVLSTVHKAKGREAERVFLYRPELLGLSQGDPEADLSEGNVLFVALTRAKRELVLVEAQRGAVAARLATGEQAQPRAQGAGLADVGPATELEGRTPPTPLSGSPHAANAGLHRRWNDVLRLATIMARSPGSGATPPRRADGGHIIRHGATRRVQEPRRQAGGGGRGGGRR